MARVYSRQAALIRDGLAWLGLAWLGLAWLGLAKSFHEARNHESVELGEG